MSSVTGISSEFERYENGGLAEEKILIDALVTKIGHLQHINRDQKTGKLHRGTHAKGLTCMNAEFEVFDVASKNSDASPEMIAKLKKGMYSTPGRYPARARYANGLSEPGSDTKADERALSFSVDLGSRGRQDFSMNSATIFPIPSLKAFNFVFTLSLIKGVRAGHASDEARKYMWSRLRQAVSVRTLLRIPESVHTLRQAIKVTRREVNNLRQTGYWSGTAFRHGEHDAIKFIALPSGGEKLGPPPVKAGADYLQDDIKRWVNEQAQPVTFDFRLQFLDAATMRLGGKTYDAWEWVEDCTLDWDAAGARDYLVGRLTIPPRSIADDCDDPVIFPAFDVTGNSLPEHKPLGRINRGRAVVEMKSRDNRA